MPQISITISDRDLVFLKKLAIESGVSRSEKAKELLRIGITQEVQEQNALAVFLSMEEKRHNQRIMIEYQANLHKTEED